MPNIIKYIKINDYVKYIHINITLLISLLIVLKKHFFLFYMILFKIGAYLLIFMFLKVVLMR